MLVQQDDERIIQEIQKEGEAELNKKSAGGSPQCLCLSRLSLRSSHVILIWTDVEIRELIFPCRNQSPYFILLRGFLSVLFRQLSCLQHKPAADAGLFPVFSLYHCVCVKCVRQAGVYYTGQEDAALPLIFFPSLPPLENSGKRVGPPPEPITDTKRPRVGPPPEIPPNQNPLPLPPPQAVQAPLFVPPRPHYPPAPPQGQMYHQVIMPRLPPAPYVPPLQHLPPLNNNNNNLHHHHHHHHHNDPPVNPLEHNIDLPMHYGPPHRYYRRF